MYKVYQGENGKWFWHRIRKNGRITADGGQGYSTRQGAIQAADDERGLNKDRPIRWKDDPYDRVW